MIRSEMITSVREMVGDVDGAQFTDAQIVNFLNWGMDDIVRDLEFNIKETNFVALAGGTLVGSIATPADFLRDVQVRWNGTRLQRMNYREAFPMAQDIELSSGTTPTHYAVSPYGGATRQILFWPHQAVTQAAAITLVYVSRAAHMTANGDTCPLPVDLHPLVVLYGVRSCKMSEGDFQAAAFIFGDIQRRLAEARYYMGEHDAFTNPEVGGDGEAVFSHYD